MAGRTENLQKGWDTITKAGIRLDPPEPLGRFLGCGVESITITEEEAALRLEHVQPVLCTQEQYDSYYGADVPGGAEGQPSAKPQKKTAPAKACLRGPPEAANSGLRRPPEVSGDLRGPPAAEEKSYAMAADHVEPPRNPRRVRGGCTTGSSKLPEIQAKRYDMLHLTDQCANRYLECANISINGLRKAPTPGLDDSNFKQEDFETAGVLGTSAASV